MGVAEGVGFGGGLKASAKLMSRVTQHRFRFSTPEPNLPVDAAQMPGCAVSTEPLCANGSPGAAGTVEPQCS